MNKKFLVVALMAALSTVGYAAGDDFENLQHQVNGNSQALGELAQDVITNRNNITDLGAKLEGKVDQKDFENLQHQANGNSQALGELAQDVIGNRNNIAANKAEIETNKENIAKNEAAIEKETQDRIAADNAIKEQVGKFQDQMNKYDGRLSGLEKKVDHLDDKMNKGLSIMAAMNAVDFQNVQT